MKLFLLKILNMPIFFLRGLFCNSLTTSKGVDQMNDLVTLLQNLNSAIQALQTQLTDAQAAAQAQYDKGFADGKASVTGGFTQADIDAAVKAAVDPLNAQITLFPSQLDQARASMKQSILELLQSDEQDLEAKLSQL